MESEKIAVWNIGCNGGIMPNSGCKCTFSDYNASRSVHWKIVADDDELIDLEPVQPYAYLDPVTG